MSDSICARGEQQASGQPFAASRGCLAPPAARETSLGPNALAPCAARRLRGKSWPRGSTLAVRVACRSRAPCDACSPEGELDPARPRRPPSTRLAAASRPVTPAPRQRPTAVRPLAAAERMVSEREG
ncbi:unnamed protein product [Urochloa humidicola]